MGGFFRIPPFFFVQGQSLELNKVRSGIELKLYNLALQIVTENEYVLYDVEYIKGSSTLQVYIMDPATKSAIIEDCIKVDRAFSPYCDEEAWIPNDFVLEVSSPGVYRSLKTLDHFKSAVNEIISLSIAGHLNEKEQAKAKGVKSAKKFRGKLLEVTEEYIIIDSNSVELKISFEQMKKASLDPDIKRQVSKETFKEKTAYPFTWWKCRFKHRNG